MSKALTKRAAKLPKAEPALRITAKVATAIDAMVWQGLSRADAAKAAGITDHALYCALRKPHVKAAYLNACEVLRVSGKARRIHRLGEIGEQSENLTAAVNAIRAAENLDDTAAGSSTGAHTRPGLTIVIEGNANIAAVAHPIPETTRTIEAPRDETPRHNPCPIFRPPR